MNNEIVEAADIWVPDEGVCKLRALTEIRHIQSNGVLNELIEFIRERQVELGRKQFSVGQDVWVVQKTRRTAGVVKKILRTRCSVNMNGLAYDVPMSMLEPK
jgi:hypothetical protein